MSQADLAGICKVGNRFLVELEAGKPTIQFDEALYVAANLGLELYLRKKGEAGCACGQSFALYFIKIRRDIEKTDSDTESQLSGKCISKNTASGCCLAHCRG